jgi:DNA-binding GntR family transcriptional regulator
LPPGEKLKIEVLQREFNFSSTPLREALNRLTAEGLAIFEENRGFRTAPISAADLSDITRTRILVETAALADSIENGDSEWEGRIVSAFHRLDRIDRQIESGSVPRGEDWTQMHKAFHMALLSACRSPRIVTMCASLFDQSERYRRLSTRIRTVPRHTGDEHKTIMQAILDRDLGQANALLTSHIETTAANVGRILGEGSDSRKEPDRP